MSHSFPKLTAEEAASHIRHGQTVGFSGFTPAGTPKAIPLAVAKLAKLEHEAGREFQIAVLTGASTGPSLDGALAEAGAISFRTPYQSNAALRSSINKGETHFVDMHLSMLPQTVRYGFLGEVDWAVVEACDITPGGGIVLSTSVGAAPTFLGRAKKVTITKDATTVVGGAARLPYWGPMLASALDIPLTYREGGEVGAMLPQDETGERDEAAPAVIKKIHRSGRTGPDPLHGLFEVTIDGADLDRLTLGRPERVRYLQGLGKPTLHPAGARIAIGVSGSPCFLCLLPSQSMS